ncbi:FG-GAP repeat domain-containing protein [Nereida sp. NH-UV-3]|uniref:FG-GAP repeat domain-containing protein n=1 Tax=Nereida TaxID=282198 RepID=UPI0036F42CDD
MIWRAAWLVATLVCLAGGGAAQTIQAARFTDPTTRYAHGVLGDAVEYGGLQITVLSSSCKRIIRSIMLPVSHVFEDIAPRLWDVTGDGLPEVVVIETDVARGAALAIYGPNGKLAETPHIGRTNRWLAPIGSADLDGDGIIEIAYIDRPHLAKELRVWSFVNGDLRPLARASGLTNHRIGEDFISGALIQCNDIPTIITANADWSRRMGTVLQAGTLISRDLGPFAGRKSLERC